jgi:transcriptional regulator with XRE-family HTH domain
MKHPVDVHVGKRVRHRRWMVGMTQQQLGDIVGIKFQQIQKYETGMNRISASRLWDIAQALGVSISFFFEGFEGEEVAAESREPARADGPRGDLWPTRKRWNWCGPTTAFRRRSAAGSSTLHGC